jgi:glucan phosphorylase
VIASDFSVMTSTLRPAQDIPAPASYGDAQRTGLTADHLRDGVTEHLFFTLGRSITTATPHDLYMALSHAVRDRLISRHLASKDTLRNQRPKALDGANVEIRKPVGEENFFLFGLEMLHDLEERLQHLKQSVANG